MEFSARIRRDDASRDSYSPGLSRFSSSSSTMAIPMSPAARADNSSVNAPPPLPPPRHPVTDPQNYDRRPPGYSSSSSFGSRHASGSSGYGSLADSMSSSSDVYDFRRREVKPIRDEGYSSLSVSASRRPEPTPAQPFLTHNSFSFKSYGDSLKDKLDPKPSQPRSALSLSLDTEQAQPPVAQAPCRSMLAVFPPISLPTRPRLLEEPERFMQTPIHTAALSPGFPGFAVGGERSQDAMSSDMDRSPRRMRRTDSSSTPEDMAEDGNVEAARRLCIDDSRPDHLTPGQKRRASSPAVEEPPASFFAFSGDPRRREGPPRGSRGSPVPRLSGMHQSSFSSVSSTGRSNSYVFSATGLSAAAAAPPGFGRRSPVPYSPGGMSPLGTGLDCASPFNAPVSLDPSPRTSISRMVSPQQRSVADSRAMPSPRKLSGVNRSISSSGGVQDFYMCECCLKKPKKFDTREELAAHEAEKQYECTFCGNRFKNKNEAERHQNSLHVRPHSWSCSALTSYERAYHESTPKPGLADTCGYCGEEFERHGDFATPTGARNLSQADWDERARHLQEVHKFRECNSSKKFYRADHFRQHLKHSHAGTSGKWTNMLETACMIEEEQPTPN